MSEKELLLGRQTPAVTDYAPQLLYPIVRGEGRESLPGGGTIPLYGCDQWHAYEMSWLDAGGRPEVRVGRFRIAADSLAIVESKSFKLYLNSLNRSRFDTEEAFKRTVVDDLSQVTRSKVELDLFPLDASDLAGKPLAGVCVDGFRPGAAAEGPDAALLLVDTSQYADEALYSHLVRSLCPVTGQPDWASVRIQYRGARIDGASFLTYLLAYREHPEFHEQCVERIFCDVVRAAAPENLEVQGFYTRRGGLDINPYRSTHPDGTPLPRLNRQ